MVLESSALVSMLGVMAVGMVLESSALVSMLGVMAVGMVLESSALVSMLGVMAVGMVLESSALVSMLGMMAVGMVLESSASKLVHSTPRPLCLPLPLASRLAIPTATTPVATGVMAEGMALKFCEKPAELVMEAIL